MVGRLLPGRKLIVISFVVLLLLTFASRAYLTQAPRTQIQFHEQERKGIHYLRSVTSLLLEVTQARVGIGRDLDGAVAALDTTDRQYGKALGTSKQWARCKDLLAEVGSRTTTTFEQYNRLTKGLTDLIDHVANTSNLLLDPDLDSYHLMDIVVIQQPMLLDEVGQAAQLITRGGSVAPIHDGVVIARSNIGRAADAIREDLTTAFASTQDVRVKAARRPGAAFADNVAQTLRALTGVPVEGQPPLDVSPLLASTMALNAVSVTRLDDLIADRIATLERRVGTTTVVVLVLFALLQLLGIGRVRSLRLAQQQTEELRRQSLGDARTGIANRAAFDLTLNRMLKQRRPAGHGPTVFLLDIDAFKTVNDRYGHHIGDLLLHLTAQRLTALVRGGDLVARLGGDEFGVLVDDSDVRGALTLAARITSALSEPADVGGVRLTPAISMGVYVPDGTADAEQALICADEAMYFAKATGGGYQMFDPERHRSFVERYQLELDLREAHQLGQLVLHYQPIVELATQQVVAVEALIRWNHPTRGLLYPDAFIEVAEESGAIVDIGRWVLAQACADGQRLVAGMPEGQQFIIAVNVSRRQLASPTLCDDVSRALAANGLAPDHLALEVTETALMHDEVAMVEMLHQLKVLGVKLAMDDFGTGYSSLAQLRMMPIDLLKIDKTFVNGVTSGQDDWAFAAAIIALAHSLGKLTLAEGIEHSSQHARLLSLGCELGQGFLFARPMPLQGVIDIVTAPQNAAATSEQGASR